MHGCHDFQQWSMNRRCLMRIGSLGLAGLSLPRLLQAEDQATNGATMASLVARAKHIIFLHQCGGPSHIDTFDMKPNAPDGIRGTFRPIASSEPGLQVCEHLPRWGKQLHLWGQVRSVNHRMKNHNSAGYYCLSGHSPPTDDIRCAIRWNCFRPMGRWFRSFWGDRIRSPTVRVVSACRVGWFDHTGQHASFLGKAHDPFFFRSDPNAPDFALPELQLPSSVDLSRLENRRQLLQVIDRQVNLKERFAKLVRWIPFKSKRCRC